ncbi:hypothetical protein [Dermatobacter hominis]|uniref:hypothetical protein n=1 Tax=Dermatobacter hominis TaxID=2884263 RepID=UPI001D108AD4|nr:hypothetical protein [Dermatobacter hominis]UDY33952.1 hypothetical protein LH044_11400 [Dermatobacter hominis]
MPASRTFRADGVALRVEIDPSAPEAIADHLHVVLGGYDSTEDPPAAVLRVRGGHGEASVVSGPPGSPELHFARWPDVLAHVDGWVSASSLDYADPRHLRLHAAHFVLDRQRWIVIGPKGSGKSTLTLSATAAGARWCTDERITLSDDCDGGSGVTIRPLRRPLHIRSSRDEVRRQLGTTGTFDSVETAGRTIVDPDPSEDPRSVPSAEGPLQVVVLDEAAVATPPTTRTEVTRRIVGHSMDARRCGHRTIELLHHLVRTADVYVAAPRTLLSVAELDAPSFTASPSAEVLAAMRSNSLEGVWSLVDGDRVLAWVESEGSPAVLELEGVAAERWSAAMADDAGAWAGASEVIRSIDRVEPV